MLEEAFIQLLDGDLLLSNGTDAGETAGREEGAD